MLWYFNMFFIIQNQMFECIIPIIKQHMYQRYVAVASYTNLFLFAITFEFNV